MAIQRSRGGQRKPDYTTTWGEVVTGAYMSADGRLRPIGRSSPAFGPAKDERLAVHRFRLWQSKQTGNNFEPIDDYPPAGELLYVRQQEKDRIRNLFLTDLKAAAVDLNIPWIADYPHPQRKPAYTLAELGQFYLANKRNKQGAPLHPKHRENQQRFWNAFCDAVRVTYPRDLTQEHIRQFKDSILEKFDAGDFAADTVRARFVCVKAVINYGLTNTDDKDDLRRALDLCRILEAPSSSVDPSPITPEDFRALHSAAGTREKAMLLMGLNCCMHGGEVCKVMRSEVDLKARTFTGRRSKTGLPRVAWLWQRTIDAIREYQAEHPHKSDFLFVSKQGGPVTSEAFRQRVVDIKKRANKSGAQLSDEVTYEGCRDAAYTIADECDSDRARFIAGHKAPGQSDAYVLRQAASDRVKRCCEAIERHYFPPKTKTKGKK